MKSKLLPIIGVSIFIFVACTTNQKVESEPSGLDFDAIADLIMDRMDLQLGETVLLVGAPGRFDQLIPALQNRIDKSLGDYLGAISVEGIQPDDWNSAFVDAAADLSDEELMEYLKQVDIGIMLPGANSEDTIYAMIQDNLNDGVGRTIHFHWAGAYDLEGQEMDVTPEIDRFYQEALLKTNYRRLARDQKGFEEAMRGNTIRVTTPAGTDIEFQVGDRPVTKQSGDASARTARSSRNLIDREMELPAGAIRVAPIETTVNGRIVFPDALWADSLVTGLILTFESGKVTDMEAQSGIEWVQMEMDEAGDAARSFREFALGTNPQLAIPDENPWIPYYGYGAGVVRLSLGDNSELGGNVTGGFVRWNFFTDATVMVGDELWVEDGKIVK